MNPCIVYLAQNTPKDSNYGRNSRAMLERSLDLLYKNYNDQFGQDILIFHEGDFDTQSQHEIIKGRKEIKFQEIHFEIPSFLNRDEIPELWDGRYPIGFRHMIRFYYLLIFDILEDLGYDWFMRMDDDSYLHSKIDYDLFKFMQDNEYEYGYRAIIKEPLHPTYGFSEMVLAYLKAERIKPDHFFENFDRSIKLNHEAFSLKGQIKRVLTKTLESISEKINYELNNWPAATEWNRETYYNNFLITRIGFWKQAEIQSFLHYFDRVGGGYKYRWADHIVQTVAVQIFLSKDRVHQFDDWTYEHATIIDEQLQWGGMFAGSNDKDRIAVNAFKEKYGKLRHDE